MGAFFRFSTWLKQPSPSCGEKQKSHLMYHWRAQQWIFRLVSLGQWNSLIRLWPTNEWRRGDSQERGGKEEGNFWKWLQTHFLVYPAFEKRKKDPLPSTHTGPPLIVSLPPPDSPLRPTNSTHLNPYWFFVNHSCSVLFHFCSLALADSFQSFNKLFSLFFYPFLPFLMFYPLSHTLCYCRNKGSTCKQFPHEINLGPVPFHIGPALVYFKWARWLRLKLMAGNL